MKFVVLNFILLKKKNIKLSLVKKKSEKKFYKNLCKKLSKIAKFKSKNKMMLTNKE